MARNDSFSYEVKIRAQERLSNDQLNAIIEKAVTERVRYEVGVYVKDRVKSVLEQKAEEIDSKILEIFDEKIFHDIFEDFYKTISGSVDQMIRKAADEQTS